MKIGVMGGYGFNNVGDEGQLSACLRTFKQMGHEDLVVFSPNEEFTSRYHDVLTYPATRNTVYLEAKLPFYKSAKKPQVSMNWKNIIRSLMAFPLMFMGLLFVLNVYLFKLIGWCPLYRETIKNIKSLDRLHFSGGGYFTGDTYSRLLDFSIVMIVCRIFGVNVTMSGQTLGLWGKGILSKFVKYAIKEVSSISLRDKDKSRIYLEDIGYTGSIDEVCDDAYGIEKSLSNDEDYVILHFHYWGNSLNVEYHEKVKQIYVGILNNLKGRGFNCVLMSMTPTDDDAMKEFSDNNGVEFSSSDESFDRKMSIYSSSNGVITMKHHPIIFGFLHKKPVISFYDSPYYKQKNDGAFESVFMSNKNILLDYDLALKEVSEFPYNISGDSSKGIDFKINERKEWFVDKYSI